MSINEGLKECRCSLVPSSIDIPYVPCIGHLVHIMCSKIPLVSFIITRFEMWRLILGRSVVSIEDLESGVAALCLKDSAVRGT